MEIPSYDEFNELENNISRVAGKLDRLIDALDVKKEYVVGSHSFNSKDEAQQFINKIIFDTQQGNPGATGSYGNYTIDVWPKP